MGIDPRKVMFFDSKLKQWDMLKNTHMFDTPIYGKNKATPFFYNVDIGYNRCG